jgi:putative phosphoesterase
MKVCILSDSHDHIALLDAAVAEAKAMGAEAVLHCGDVVAPSTLRCLEAHGLPVHVIHGNNTGDMFTLGRLAADPASVIHYHGMDAGIHLGGRRVFLVHYPHYARAMAVTGDWDVVCCGHSHTPSQEQLANVAGGETLLLNPGTVGGVGRAPATYLLLDLETLDCALHRLDEDVERRPRPSTAPRGAT